MRVNYAQGVAISGCQVRISDCAQSNLHNNLKSGPSADHFHGRKLLKGDLSRAAEADPTAAMERNPTSDNVIKRPGDNVIAVTLADGSASQVDVVKLTWAAWVAIALFTALALGAWQWWSG